MTNYQLTIYKPSDKKIRITYRPSSMVEYLIESSEKELKKKLKIDSIEQISPHLIQSNLKKLSSITTKTNFFDSKVISFSSTNKEFTIQIEDELIHLHNNKNGEELFLPKSQIYPQKNWYKIIKGMNQKRFYSLLDNKKKIIPLKTNISTNETDMGFQLDFDLASST